MALTIAGSDSGGSAGVQADLKTFAALGVHGTSAIACLTAQNPNRVRAIEPVSPKMLRQQIVAVFEEFHPPAVKIGMLFSPENVRVVASFFRKLNPSPARGGRAKLIIDPATISTSGARLLKPAALKILQRQLLPLATLVTPNLAEAEVLAGQNISSIENMRTAAREIHERFGCAALVKGGHLRGMTEAADIFFDGKTELLLTAPFIKGMRTHGTGCTYSAAIAAALALGRDLPQAVKLAKNYITQAIAGGYRAGKYFTLNHSPTRALPN